MADTAIQWTDKVWNPTTGCTRVSEGCRNCYAFQLHDQRHAAFVAGKVVPKQYAKPFRELQLFEDRLADPLSWRKPQRVFVNSMSDLFHKDVPDEFIDRVFAVMALAGRHTFQVLTKRPDRMAEYVNRLAKSIVPLESAARGMGYTFKFRGLDGRELSNLPWPIPSVWLGTSVEDQKAADERIPHLLKCPAAVRFLSCEPLLGPVNLDAVRFDRHTAMNVLEGVGYSARSPCQSMPNARCERVHWVIVGGESGPDARTCRVEWVRSVVDQCKAAGVPCFVKQLGANVTTTLPDGEAWPGHSGPTSPVQFSGDGFGNYLVSGLRDKKGGDSNEFPADLRVREFPKQ